MRLESRELTWRPVVLSMPADPLLLLPDLLLPCSKFALPSIEFCGTVERRLGLAEGVRCRRRVIKWVLVERVRGRKRILEWRT